jgi:ABC-type uncharacterized transport system substrate-binding protein
MSRQCRLWAAALITAAGFLVPFSQRAAAHPHVWVNVETTVIYENGKVTGFRHKWAFDDMYTAMAIEGLDKNGDGAYSKEELAELAQVNIDGLKEFGYFTYVKLGSAALKTKEPTDYWLEYSNGILSLYFTLPLEEPVLAEADGLNFTILDESFFIAFDFVKDNPIKLGNAPHGCSARIGVPEKDLQQLQSLNNAFGGQLTAGDANMGTGSGYSQTVTIACKKS